MGGNTMKMNKKGFTLIELLIVVAIIAILAAIAIPQFAAYRMRGYNAAANTDIRNAKTAQEALFADYQTYGRTQTMDTLANAAGTSGAGVLIAGPLVAATATLAGGMITGDNTAGQHVAVGTGLSNNVGFVSTNMAPASGTASPSYVMATKHMQGDREFGTETESTAIVYAANGAWAGTALAADGTPATFPAAATVGIDISGTAGGSPITDWSTL
jgi:prepilin-type N-terminal cleavage/methylation domain-containing protein